MDGIIIVDKEKEMTSHDVINKLRKIFKTKKVGHCGTLDPEATGVLVCLVNKATKLSNFLILDSKEYLATFKLGIATTTQDLEGEIIEEVSYQNDCSIEKIKRVLEGFQGEIKQVPSIYSAIKVNGKKLYEYARNNEPVVIPERTITIHEIELLALEDDLVSIRVNCSSGTYIRTLCYDIARQLGYPGALVELRRTKSGNFNIEDSSTLEQIANNDYRLIKIIDALGDYDKVYLTDEQYEDVRNGKPLSITCQKPFVAVYDNEVQAIYDQAIEGIAKIKRGLW